MLSPPVTFWTPDPILVDEFGVDAAATRIFAAVVPAALTVTPRAALVVLFVVRIAVVVLNVCRLAFERRTRYGNGGPASGSAFA